VRQRARLTFHKANPTYDFPAFREGAKGRDDGRKAGEGRIRNRMRGRGRDDVKDKGKGKAEWNG
jgi:hypothetical protein